MSCRLPHLADRPDLRSVVLDAPLEDLSAGRLVAVVDWRPAPSGQRCDVVEVAEHVPVRWDLAPGTPTRVSRLDFAAAVPTLGGGGTWTVYVLDRRILARHYTFPATGAGPLRLYPRPEVAPARIAVGPSDGDVAAWEVFACGEAAVQEEAAEGDAPAGLIVDLIDGVARAAWSARHRPAATWRSCATAPPRAPCSGAETPRGRASGSPRPTRRSRTTSTSPARPPRASSCAWTGSSGPSGRASTSAGREEVYVARLARRTAVRRWSSATASAARGCPPAGTTSRRRTASAAAPRARSTRAPSTPCSAASGA